MDPSSRGVVTIPSSSIVLVVGLPWLASRSFPTGGSLCGRTAGRHPNPFFTPKEL
jgi:hypothetical protein